jgi:hypothetical protein
MIQKSIRDETGSLLDIGYRLVTVGTKCVVRIIDVFLLRKKLEYFTQDGEASFPGIKDTDLSCFH